MHDHVIWTAEYGKWFRLGPYRIMVSRLPPGRGPRCRVDVEAAVAISLGQDEDGTRPVDSFEPMGRE